MHGAAALPAATHPDRTAASSTFGLNQGAAVQSQFIAFQRHASAQASAAVGAKHAVADNQLGRRGLLRQIGQSGFAFGLQVNSTPAVGTRGVKHRSMGLDLLLGSYFNLAAHGGCGWNALLSIYSGFAGFLGNRQHLTRHLRGLADLHLYPTRRTTHRRHVQNTGAGLVELLGLDLDLRLNRHNISNHRICSRSNH